MILAKRMQKQMSDKKQALQGFVKQMQTGIQLIKDNKYEEGMNQLKPYVALMEEANTYPIRMFAYYAMAQFKTGDIDGFIQTYEKIQSIDAVDEEDEKVKQIIHQWFVALMDQMGKH